MSQVMTLDPMLLIIFHVFVSPFLSIFILRINILLTEKQPSFEFITIYINIFKRIILIFSKKWVLV